MSIQLQIYTDKVSHGHLCFIKLFEFFHVLFRFTYILNFRQIIAKIVPLRRAEIYTILLNIKIKRKPALEKLPQGEHSKLLYRVFLECSDRVTVLIRIITDDALHIPGQYSRITTIWNSLESLFLFNMLRTK